MNVLTVQRPQSDVAAEFQRSSGQLLPGELARDDLCIPHPSCRHEEEDVGTWYTTASHGGELNPQIMCIIMCVNVSGSNLITQKFNKGGNMFVVQT